MNFVTINSAQLPQVVVMEADDFSLSLGLSFDFLHCC